MSLGWAIKTYRTRPSAAITQDKLSRKTNIAYGRLSKFESDLVRPTEKELKAIAKVLKADPENIKRLADSGEPIMEVAK
jgi:transcriptional regulator with XRE-family HTH domain